MCGEFTFARCGNSVLKEKRNSSSFYFPPKTKITGYPTVSRYEQAKYVSPLAQHISKRRERIGKTAQQSMHIVLHMHIDIFIIAVNVFFIMTFLSFELPTNSVGVFCDVAIIAHIFSFVNPFFKKIFHTALCIIPAAAERCRCRTAFSALLR